jgi:hypothetical protein
MKEESSFFKFRESLRSDKKILQIYQKVMSPQTRKYEFKNGQQNSPNTKKGNLMQNFDCKKNSLKVAQKGYGDPRQNRIISSDKFIDNQFKRSNFTNIHKKINEKNNQDFQCKFLQKRIESLESNQPSNNLMTQYRNNSKNDLITQKSDLVLKQKLEIQHKNCSSFKKSLFLNQNLKPRLGFRQQNLNNSPVISLNIFVSTKQLLQNSSMNNEFKTSPMKLTPKEVKNDKSIESTMELTTASLPLTPISLYAKNIISQEFTTKTNYLNTMSERSVPSQGREPPFIPTSMATIIEDIDSHREILNEAQNLNLIIDIDKGFENILITTTTQKTITSIIEKKDMIKVSTNATVNPILQSSNIYILTNLRDENLFKTINSQNEIKGFTNSTILSRIELTINSSMKTTLINC